MVFIRSLVLLPVVHRQKMAFYLGCARFSGANSQGCYYLCTCAVCVLIVCARHVSMFVCMLHACNLLVSVSVEAGEGRMVHNDGWNGANGMPSTMYDYSVCDYALTLVR